MARLVLLALALFATIVAADPVDEALAALRPLQVPGGAGDPPFALECRWRTDADADPVYVRISYETPDRYSIALFAPNGVPVMAATETTLACVDREMRLRAYRADASSARLELIAQEGKLGFTWSYAIATGDDDEDGVRVLVDLAALRRAVDRLSGMRAPGGAVRLFGRSKAHGTPFAAVVDLAGAVALRELTLASSCSRSWCPCC
jgi:hypothetical protein